LNAKDKVQNTYFGVKKTFWGNGNFFFLFSGSTGEIVPTMQAHYAGALPLEPLHQPWGNSHFHFESVDIFERSCFSIKYW
jgi:hypothetical protein